MSSLTFCKLARCPNGQFCQKTRVDNFFQKGRVAKAWKLDGEDKENKENEDGGATLEQVECPDQSAVPNAKGEQNISVFRYHMTVKCHLSCAYLCEVDLSSDSHSKTICRLSPKFKDNFVLHSPLSVCVRA